MDAGGDIMTIRNIALAALAGLTLSGCVVSGHSGYYGYVPQPRAYVVQPDYYYAEPRYYGGGWHDGGHGHGRGHWKGRGRGHHKHGH